MEECVAGFLVIIILYFTIPFRQTFDLIEICVLPVWLCVSVATKMLIFHPIFLIALSSPAYPLVGEIES